MTHPAWQEICPYCARRYEEVEGGVTREHVFGAANGGRATIPACKECNNRLGGTVEGRLSRSTSVAAIPRFAAGLTHLPGKAMVEGVAEPVDIVISPEGRPRLAHPEWDTAVIDDVVSVNVMLPEGSDLERAKEDIAKALRRKGVDEELANTAAAHAVANAQPRSQFVNVTASPEVSISDLRVHWSQTAIAASVLAGLGPSLYMDNLRAILNDDGGEIFDPHHDSVDQEIVQRFVPPSLEDGLPASQVTIVRVADVAAVSVHQFGNPHMHGMKFVRPAPPELADDEVLIVRETSQPYEVVRLQ
ncbi:HNH endonuclease [Euzebya pacifica]|uniref:HNH endonuclease n=1 Tax=Euzebya pacifica TaxID=1608957 RepID=UPI0030F829CD